MSSQLKRAASMAPASVVDMPVKRAKSLTDSSITDFFKPINNEKVATFPQLLITWHNHHQSLLHLRVRKAKDSQASSNSEVKCRSTLKLAAFDLDGTLIRAKDGRVFSRNANDWEFMFNNVPDRLKQLHSDGYHIVIYSNQKGLPESKNRMQDFKIKLGNVAKKIEVPFDLLGALAGDEFRKPRIGMHCYYLQNILAVLDKDEITRRSAIINCLNLEHSFYVGDAAGRGHCEQAMVVGSKTKQKKDHSAVDRKFADNLSLPFRTPEEFFRDEPVRELRLDFDPLELKQKQEKSVSVEQNNVTGIISTDKQEMLVMCGWPASGKTTFAKNLAEKFPKFVNISLDDLKHKEKMEKALRSALAQGKSVIVDCTNPSAESRAAYIRLARNHDPQMPINCVHMLLSKAHCEHNNVYRSVIRQERDLLPRVAFNTFGSRFQEPTENEGFNRVYRVPFKPLFKHESHAEDYYQHLS